MVCRGELPDKGSHVKFAKPPWDRNHPDWIRLNEQLPDDHVARWMVEAVQLLDLGPLVASYLGRGSRPIRPDLMLTMVLIEIQQGRPSPSQWHRDATENIGLLWAGFGIAPSRSRWYEFRDRLAPFIDAWHVQVVQIAIERNLTTAEQASLDGSAVAACASRHRLVNEDQLKKRLGQLEEARVCDAQGGVPDSVPGWMAKHPHTRNEQYDRYQRAEERLRELHAINERQDPSRRRKQEKIVVSPSDPEAALGRDKLKVFRPLYNVQSLRDLHSPLVLAFGVFAQNTDAGTLGPMLERGSESTGKKPHDLLVDATYITATNLALCELAGVTPCGPWQQNDYSKKNKQQSESGAKRIPKDQFEWLPEEKVYRCSQGHLLRWIGRNKRRQADGQINIVHSYRCSPEHCRACPIRDQCTTNPDRGRSVKRSEHEELIEAHRARMDTDEAKELYKLRKQTVELGFADMKEHRSLRKFNGRGLTRVRAQTGLTVLANNLLHTIRGPPTTKTDADAALTPKEIPV